MDRWARGLLLSVFVRQSFRPVFAATAEEIAQAVLWCSPGAGFVVGVALPVDGGCVAR